MDISVEGQNPPHTKPSYRQLLTGAGLNVALALLSGVLAGLAFPPFEWWVLAWVALVPLLIALGRTSAVRAAGYLMLVFGLTLCSVSLHWMTVIFHGAFLGIFLLVALPWYLFGVGYRTLISRSPQWALLLMAPTLWVAVEWIRCEGWYFRFSWLQLGFTQVPWRHAETALFPLIGVYGVTFLILMVNAAVAFHLARRQWWQAGAILVAIPAFALAAPFLKPTYPLSAGTSARQSAVIVQSESGILDEPLRLSRNAVTANTRLVIWPEYALMEYLLSDHLAHSDLQEIQAFTRKQHCTLVLGTKEHAPADAPCDWLRRRSMTMMGDGLFNNIALVIGPEGKILGQYAKTHPIQFFSDGVPGRSFHTIPTPGGRIGIAICYDFDYAHTALRLVHNGAQLLVVPTFDEITWGKTQHQQHTRIAQARAAEVGRYTLRATSSGFSQSLDPTGQALVTIPYGDSTAVSTTYSLISYRNLYVRATWCLPYLCLGISLLWGIGIGVMFLRRILVRHTRPQSLISSPPERMSQ